MASFPIPASPKPWGGPQDTAKNPWDYMKNWRKKKKQTQHCYISYYTTESIPWQNFND